MSDLMRHIEACNNAVLPGARVRFIVDGAAVGWVEPALARRLLALGAVADGAVAGGAVAGGAVRVPSGEVQRLAKALADQGEFDWRDEAFDVRADADGRAVARLDRGALPAFGVRADGVHLNGLVRRGGATLMWVARRARHKMLDPGKLDHLVAGGVSAGFTPLQTLAKEASEEAALPEPLVRAARPVAVIAYAMQRIEGLRRDRLHCYDLVLPETFAPQPLDGEVEAFELWELPQVLERVRQTDDFKFNVNLVLIDLFLRRDMLPPGEAASLRTALYR